MVPKGDHQFLTPLAGTLKVCPMEVFGSQAGLQIDTKEPDRGSERPSCLEAAEPSDFVVYRINHPFKRQETTMTSLQ